MSEKQIFLRKQKLVTLYVLFSLEIFIIYYSFHLLCSKAKRSGNITFQFETLFVFNLPIFFSN